MALNLNWANIFLTYRHFCIPFWISWWILQSNYYNAFCRIKRMYNWKCSNDIKYRRCSTNFCDLQTVQNVWKSRNACGSGRDRSAAVAEEWPAVKVKIGVHPIRVGLLPAPSTTRALHQAPLVFATILISLHLLPPTPSLHFLPQPCHYIARLISEVALCWGWSVLLLFWSKNKNKKLKVLQIYHSLRNLINRWSS